VYFISNSFYLKFILSYPPFLTALIKNEHMKWNKSNIGAIL